MYSSKESIDTLTEHRLRDILLLRRHLFANFSLNFPKKELCSKVKNLDATEDGEASEESHCATNQTQLCHQGHLSFQK